MRLIACMCCKNEEWVAGLSARAALLWNDAIVVLLHECTDRSQEIIGEIAQEVGRERVIVLRVSGDWLEMQHRTMMLQAARVAGATHISIVDFDEILTGSLISGAKQTTLPRADWQHDAIRQAVRSTPSDAIIQLPGYNLRNGINQYHSNGIWSDRWFSIAFEDALDLGWSGDKFHSREPGPRKLQPYRPIQQGQGGIVHLWGASERRLRAKHCWYKIIERLRWPEKKIGEINQMYSWAIRGPSLGDCPETWLFKKVPESWWAPYAQWMKYLDVDAEPWQEKECQRLVALHGREMFAGLDLFEVA